MNIGAFMILMAIILDGGLSLYNMDPYITCWENNRYSYRGYHDPSYENDTRYIAAGGEGDVCDHTDSISGEVRDVCYFQVMLGQETWTYKCMYHNECPLKDPETGEGIMGCYEVTNKRITCCCNTDRCNGIEYQQYADLGYPENFTPEYEDRSNKPGTDTDTDTDTDIDTDTETDTESDTDTLIEGDTDTIQTYDNDPNQLTEGECLITDAEGRECSCGGDCKSIIYEYEATTEKCGSQTLVTGGFGEESCNPNNPSYEIGQTVTCEVTDCDNGEFRITSKGIMINVCGLYKLIPIFYVFYKIFY